jgi:hypothetical protein
MFKVEDRKPNSLGLQLSVSKVENKEHRVHRIQLSVPKVESQKPNALGLQLSVLKVKA